MLSYETWSNLSSFKDDGCFDDPNVNIDCVIWYYGNQAETSVGEQRGSERDNELGFYQVSGPNVASSRLLFTFILNSSPILEKKNWLLTRLKEVDPEKPVIPGEQTGDDEATCTFPGGKEVDITNYCSFC